MYFSYSTNESYYCACIIFVSICATRGARRVIAANRNNSEERARTIIQRNHRNARRIMIVNLASFTSLAFLRLLFAVKLRVAACRCANKYSSQTRVQCTNLFEFPVAGTQSLKRSETGLLPMRFHREILDRIMRNNLISSRKINLGNVHVIHAFYPNLIISDKLFSLL